MKVTKTFTKEELIDLANYESEILVVVEEDICGQRRWTTEFGIVFKDTRDNKHYFTHAYRGSTENQDDEDCGYYEDEYECMAVEHVDVTVKQWVPIND